MRRSENRAALTDEVARFQAEVERLALAAVHAIVRQELDRKLAKRSPARQRAETPSPADSAVIPPAVPAVSTVPAESAQSVESADSAVSAATTPEQPPERPSGRKRVLWTRESIISELATWMLSGTSIDATFVKRHGPPGLVAATRRVFGRFDAALNVAALHVSKLYPDGPPER